MFIQHTINTIDGETVSKYAYTVMVHTQSQLSEYLGMDIDIKVSSDPLS